MWRTVFDEDFCVNHTGSIAGEYVMLVVSDTGGGMDKKTLANIFEPFFTTKGVGQGTGLGLATIYGIVKQNNGFVDVYSEPGQGTIFKIYLPRHSDEQQTAAALGARPAGTGTETILLVEDQAAVLKVTRMILERLGYTVLAASTAQDAIEQAKRHPGPIHLLLTDVVMPYTTGKDLAETLAALIPDLKCLYMSGYTANIIVNKGIIEDGVNFISKPFSRADPAAQVRQVLDQ
jgi:CheY-like chemotaxis protein